MKRVDESLKETLAKEHLCYVLITCDASSVDGKLQVEMSYEGDASLASYLIHGAQGIIDDHHETGSQSMFHI